uniref:Glycosyltransferase family 92 protein n=1 Tax=Meloidogyne incognita TaxID=6306 RepID=A0A914MDR9_MELIC
MLMGIESWIALGAQKIIFPIQSASADTVLILKEYERIGIVHLRKWPKWPLLSDVNPNGLVLSRGIEESHVNCLHFVKPFAEMVVFTDIDDMLMPLDPMRIHSGVNIEILRFVPPETAPGELYQSLSDFNFSFLHQTRWKTKCKIWRMKTRVVVNASRVDSVNMHETGIHRFGYSQVRVPCRRAHFYHLRHSFKNIALNEWPIKLDLLQYKLEQQWQLRLNFNFTKIATETKLTRSSVESFADFDNCMIAINEEHWSLRVSRCLTPHVCYSRMARNMSCVAAIADYKFAYSGNGDYVSALNGEAELGPSELNCEAPLPKFSYGNHYYLP